METFGDRVRKKRIELGLSQAELAKKVGTGQSTIGQIENGRNKTFRDILNLARVLNTTPDYLTGGGEDSHFPNELIPVSTNEEDFLIVAMYTAKGECGNGYENSSFEEGKISIPKILISNTDINPKHLKAIYAIGDSMSPTINDGAMVLIDISQNTPKEGIVFAIERSGNGMVLKRLIKGQHGGWIYKSDNKAPQYEDLFAQEDDRIVGRVIWQGGNL